MKRIRHIYILVSCALIAGWAAIYIPWERHHEAGGKLRVDQLPPAALVWPDPKPAPVDPDIAEAQKRVEELKKQRGAIARAEAESMIEQMKRAGGTSHPAALEPFAGVTPLSDLKVDRSLLPPRLSEPDEFPPVYRAAARNIATTVARFGLKPDEYYVEIEVHHEDGLHFLLWHKSALKQRGDPRVHGDPSRKCYTVLYDGRYGWVTNIYGWNDDHYMPSQQLQIQ